ncbi:MAG: hypothetical protein JJU07_14575, partial [Natronohydrobacter sp.]|nr:hypothetical protein [Natronohydrobacter sp.]
NHVLKPLSRRVYFSDLLILLLLTYVGVWAWANRLRSLAVGIDETTVSIRSGDIFCQDGFKVIAFNEYFDTQVDDVVISEASLNGAFIMNRLDITSAELDERIAKHQFDLGDELEEDVGRLIGKKQKYRLGTIFVHNDFLLTTFAKFDRKNQANLTMPEYLEFLINFWDQINKVYAQKSVSVTIFGSGITRIKGHKTIGDEDLLKIMLWTFRISEMRFKYPAKLSIIIHKGKMDKVNLFDVKSEWA